MSAPPAVRPMSAPHGLLLADALLQSLDGLIGLHQIRGCCLQQDAAICTKNEL